MAELHALAQICLDLFGHSSLAVSLNAGRDVHLEFALWCAGLEYDLALKKEHKDGRQRAKAANFGFPGGMGVARFIATAASDYGVIFTVEEAQALKKRWLAARPEMPKYFQHFSRLLLDKEHFTLKQFRVERWRGKVGYCDGCNGGFQALTADGAKAALFEVSRACYAVPSSPLYGSRPIGFIHDEILTEVPAERLHEAALEKGRIMREQFDRFVPDVPSRTEATAMLRWSKNAEAVYDERGRLVPWVPAA
jgi:DNA polymerase I-like protein with 3'-5' exonuclease and polymerase domains